MHLICPPPPPPPPKNLHTLCFSFLLGTTAVPRDTENNAYAKFWGGGWGGANKVHYGKFGNGVSLKKKNGFRLIPGSFTLLSKQRLKVTLPFGFNLDGPHYHFRLWPRVKTERMKSCENLTWIMCWLFLAGWLDTPQTVSAIYGTPSSW